VPDASQSGIRHGIISNARGVFVGSQSMTHPAPPQAVHRGPMVHDRHGIPAPPHPHDGQGLSG
jgi:hypothetical protein